MFFGLFYVLKFVCCKASWNCNNGLAANNCYSTCDYSFPKFKNFCACRKFLLMSLLNNYLSIINIQCKIYSYSYLLC